MKLHLLAVLVFCAATAGAELAVTVLPPTVAGSEAVVKLEMRNCLAEKIESARAVCFLTDEQGKVVSHATQFVIGGMKDRPALETKSETTYYFVIPATKSFTTTNLAARVQFNRVILAGGKLADVTREVAVVASEK